MSMRLALTQYLRTGMSAQISCWISYSRTRVTSANQAEPLSEPATMFIAPGNEKESLTITLKVDQEEQYVSSSRVNHPNVSFTACR